MRLTPIGEDDTPLLQSFLGDSVGPILPAPNVSSPLPGSVITLARHDDGSLAGAVCYVPSAPQGTAHIPWLVPGDDGDIVPPLLRAALDNHRAAGGGTLEAFRHTDAPGGLAGIPARGRRAIMASFSQLGFSTRLRGYVLRRSLTAPTSTVTAAYAPLDVTPVTPYVRRLALTSGGSALAEIFTGRIQDGEAAVWGLTHRSDCSNAGADLLDVTLDWLAQRGAETVTAYTTAGTDPDHAEESFAVYRCAQFTQFDWLFSYVGQGSGLDPLAALSNNGRRPHSRQDT